MDYLYRLATDAISSEILLNRILKFYLNEVIKFAKAFSDIIIRDKTGFSL